MNDNVKHFVKNAINRLITHSSDNHMIEKLIKKHKIKLHFIPIRYRVFGGLLQSMNIQFGNFIEELLHIIVENENNLNILEPSGTKNVILPMTYETNNLIDDFITKRQTDINYTPISLLHNFENLLTKIFSIEKENSNKEIMTKHDIDVLFKSKKKFVYLEVKYNDDHDTGKYVDINRKFIKTYVGLCNILKIYDFNTFRPILYFLTPKILKGNIYIPEIKYIYRGERLFNEFFTINYHELDNYMTSIGDDEEIIGLFDSLYSKIRYQTNIFN